MDNSSLNGTELTHDINAEHAHRMVKLLDFQPSKMLEGRSLHKVLSGVGCARPAYY